MVGKKSPNTQGENQQTDAPHRRTCRVNARRLPATDCSVHSFALLFLLFVFLNQSCARWENCRKRQEESAHDWAVSGGDHSCYSCDQTPEKKSNRILVPLGLSQHRKIKLDSHRYPLI